MAMRRLRRTMMLIIEKLPNMMRPQNLVNSLMPVSSKLSKSIRPKAAQNKVCVVSHKLFMTCYYTISDFIVPLLGKFPVSQAVVDFDHYLFISLIEGLEMFIITNSCILKKAEY